jgi:YfiR/HmsC-like
MNLLPYEGRRWTVAWLARTVWLPVVILIAWIAVATPQAHAQYSEYDVKAAFLGNFIQFVRWPARAFPDAGSPFTICIVGSDPFGSALERSVAGQSVGGHKVTIKRSRRPEDLKSSQLVFVSKSERSRAGEILAGVQGASVLSVGEFEDFTRQGGVINFMMEGDKVRFEINTGAAQRAGLELSSKLLRLGKATASN